MAHQRRNLILDERRHAQATAGLALANLVLALRLEYFGLWSAPAELALIYLTGLGATAASLTFHLIRLRRVLDRRGYLRSIAADLVLLVPVAVAAFSAEAFVVAVLARMTVVLSRLIAETHVGQRLIAQLYLRPARLLVISFAVVIVGGTVLLTFPRATTDGRGAGAVDALFTSTSATCVTGLAVLNTVSDELANPELQSFSSFGHLVILVLIQVGGLGIMTLSGSILLLVGRRLTLRSQGVLQNILDEASGLGMIHTIRAIVLMTVIVEGAGALALFLLLGDEVPDPGQRAWASVFHSVSAFCNAGFALWGDSLTRFRADPGVNLVMSLLIIMGGLGFTVVGAVFTRDLLRRGGVRRMMGSLPVHARVVLHTTVLLLIAGMVGWYYLEYDRSLAGMGVPEKLLASWFQSVSLRTAGFNTVDFGAIGPVTILLSVVLMIIGGSPGGTAGGVKTSTVALLVLSVRSMVRGDEDVDIHGRTVPRSLLSKAVTIVVIAFCTFVVVLALLLATQPHLPFDAILFETASALGTVGLSMGVTPELTPSGKILVSLLMFVGRLGPLTLALAVGEGATRRRVRFPEARIAVG
ncbi:MAG: potassium transporter [Myxococcales bacterium]